MAILIEGTEMPESCFNCKFPRACQAITRRIDEMDKAKWFPTDHRHSDCPLTEVPEPHGRLGDLDALKDKWTHQDLDLFSQGWSWLRDLNQAPTVIPASEGKTRREKPLKSGL